MSQAQPTVTGKRVALPSSRGQIRILGVFSCHWAAIAAVVRLKVPDFKSPQGDRREDLEEEARMRVRLDNERSGR